MLNFSQVFKRICHELANRGLVGKQNGRLQVIAKGVWSIFNFGSGRKIFNSEMGFNGSHLDFNGSGAPYSDPLMTSG